MTDRPPARVPAAPDPLDDTQMGALWDGSGVRFAVRSRHATGVEVCLFSFDGSPQTRVPLTRGRDVWSVRVEGVGPGQLYGYRVDGPYRPRAGHRFNPAKLLVDPWARAVSGELAWNPAVLGYDVGGLDGERRSPLDSADFVPRSVVVDPSFDWDGDRPPRTPWGETVIYEAHVRGLTKLHPAVPPELRGTYLGLAHDAVIDHLLGMGVTAVELLPVQQSASERHLWQTGLTNYWGYSPLAWSAPHGAYASGSRGEQVREFKEMIRRLHAAGLEVLLDVVYNHTVEADERGPTLSLRGFDNATYYRAREDDLGRGVDFTGCGNTVDFSRAAARDLVHESLAYWVEEMHVDGFRFDLAPVLGRDPVYFRADAALFERLGRDPVFAGVKLIAEPWDLGPGEAGHGGYALGRFPPGWAEWNDRYRDGVRRFWRGDAGSGGELRARFRGSPDLFPERGACASINYVTAHDGFTLADLVSYERKHNLANGEENRDGANHDHSANWGVEGPTSAPEIRAIRSRLQRTFLATLALSRGVPMLAHGDEIRRTQSGNNNAYCQDNETTWVDWRLDAERQALLEFTRRAFALRRGAEFARCDAPAAPPTWLGPNGEELDPEQLEELAVNSFALLRRPGEQAERPAASLTLFNAASSPCAFRLPPIAGRGPWSILLDTAAGEAEPARPAAKRVTVAPHSLVHLAIET